MSTTAQKTDVKDEIPEVAARRLKKRELDRKAQRAARERTKSRIASLEKLVEHLSHKDVNAEVSRLMEQLLQTTQERDKLIGFLASLGTTIRYHTDAFSAQSKGSSISVVGAMQALSELPEDIKSFDQTQAPEEGATSPSYGDEYATPDSCVSLPPTDFGWRFDTSDIPIIANTSTAMPYPKHSVQNCDDMQPTPTNLPRRDSGLSQVATCSVNNFIIPQSPQPCHCSTVIQVNRHNLIPNIWRQINHALGKPVKLSQLAIGAEDRASQDTPVRAIVEGWDSVERAGMMTDSWRKLRMVDDLCFSKCRPVERLATLRMMHVLITCHGDPTPERMATLPRWFRKRPSQSLPHSYAIDFFVWPGVRERFVFSQHQYCSNLFWQLFRANLTILWQSGFNDCFIKNPATSCFQLSPLFEDRIRDIKSWTMNVDFLVQFPELCDDIPMYGGIPTQPSTLRDVSWSMTSRPGVPKTKLREGVETAQPDEGAKSSALFVPSSVPGVVETEHVPQKGKEIPTSGNSPFANEQPSSIVSSNMVPASLLSNGDMPSGQNVYSGGSWLYSYCQYGYNLGQEQ